VDKTPFVSNSNAKEDSHTLWDDKRLLAFWLIRKGIQYVWILGHKKPATRWWLCRNCHHFSQIWWQYNVQTIQESENIRKATNKECCETSKMEIEKEKYSSSDGRFPFSVFYSCITRYFREPFIFRDFRACSVKRESKARKTCHSRVLIIRFRCNCKAAKIKGFTEWTLKVNWQGDDFPFTYLEMFFINETLMNSLRLLH
jgi:hypothetical protein